MPIRTCVILMAFAIASTCAPGASAQASPEGEPQKPPPSTAAVPAAKSPQNGSSSPASPAPAAKNQPKVWTNDDLGDLRDHSSISTVGTANSNARAGAVRSAAAPHHRTAQYYKSQIARLQAQIPPIDQKISELQDAISGKQVNEVRHTWGARIDDWKNELERLQKQRDTIESRIAALEDEARHDGTSTNQIP